jgi:hypothetical protein
LLHSFTIYRRRDSFKRWAVVMATFTFALVILGTFITRSVRRRSTHSRRHVSHLLPGDDSLLAPRRSAVSEVERSLAEEFE